jgi:hypothetical protein
MPASRPGSPISATACRCCKSCPSASSASPPAQPAALPPRRLPRRGSAQRRLEGRGHPLRRHLQPLFRAREPPRRRARAGRLRLSREPRRRPRAARSAAAAPTSPPAWSTRPAPRRGARWRRSRQIRRAGAGAGALLPHDAARRVRLPAARRSGRGGCPRRAFLATEFLEAKDALPTLRPVGAGTAHIHGHCHQKAFGAFPAAVKALKRVPGMEVKPIQSSCCGMAGAFGYEAKNFETAGRHGRALAAAGGPRPARTT